MKKSKKILIFISLFLILGGGGGFLAYKHFKNEKTYEKNVISYLFYGEDEILSPAKKNEINYGSYDKKSFAFQEAANVFDRILKNEEFLFIKDYSDVKQDAKAFYRFLEDELGMAKTSSVSTVDHVYKLENGNYEILSTNYFYSKFKDNKATSMKFSTIYNERLNKVVRVKGYLNFVDTKNDKDEIVSIPQEDLVEYLLDTNENSMVGEIINNPLQDKNVWEYVDSLNEK